MAHLNGGIVYVLVFGNKSLPWWINVSVTGGGVMEDFMLSAQKGFIDIMVNRLRQDNAKRLMQIGQYHTEEWYNNKKN